MVETEGKYSAQIDELAEGIKNAAYIKLNELYVPLAIKGVNALRPRFGVLTHDRVMEEPGGEQRLEEAYVNGKHIVLAWSHGSHAGVNHVAEANRKLRHQLNKSPRVTKPIGGFLITAARDMATGKQGPLLQALSETFQEYVESRDGKLLFVDRPGEATEHTSGALSPLAQIRNRTLIKNLFVEGCVEAGRFETEEVIDTNGDKVIYKTDRRKGLQEIGATGKIDPQAFAHMLSLLKNFVIVPVGALGDFEIFDPDSRTVGLKALLTAVGMHSNKFISINMGMPISNERLEEILGKMPSHKTAPEQFAAYAQELNHFIQSEISQKMPYHLRGKYRDPILM